MAIQTKHYKINSNWQLVGSSISELLISANKVADICIFINQVVPDINTKDFILVDAVKDFSIVGLSSASDYVYVKSSGSDFDLKVLVI